MNQSTALVFGANEYATQIILQLQISHEQVFNYVLEDEHLEVSHEKSCDVALFDLGDDWDELSEKFNIEDTVIFCALEDNAENIFLTISLRASFENVYMIALANSEESANKLKMAGASKVIPVTQTTANIIVDILEKPTTTSVLHEILYEEGDLKMAELVIREDADVIGKRVSDIPWQDEYNLIVIAFVDTSYQTHFILSSHNYEHTLEENDVLVIIGYDKEIKLLKEKIGA